MPFYLRIQKKALRQLAHAWLIARDRAAVTRAEDLAERELKRDPRQAGKHLSEGLWVATFTP